MPLTNVVFKPLSWELFKFPPDNDPLALAPPQFDSELLTPFHIPPKLYNDLLSVYWPVTVATVYAVTVTLLNSYNKSRSNKPWAISRTAAFTFFVLLHNIFLTVYSAWTFVGMLGAMKRTFSGITANRDTYGFAPLLDALCKLNGPRGFGEAATFDPFSSQWTVKNQAVKLLNGNPDSSDVGRLWNEGLAFYGWLFYLSKFYEVLDTVIILAKGKRSSLLQTYHHAGAMMCMWAGIRFMSPPIWMFVQFNSGVHALMYFYYTLAALGVKVPNRIKRTLTTLQISQFVIGANFAFAHFCIGYQVPSNTPYIFTHGVASAVSSVASAAATAVPSAVAGWGPWLKKAVLRAVGDEGLAENVRGPSGQRFGIDALKAEISDTNRQEIRYRLEYPEVHCLDTSGQAFAIWLNVVYLLPLTYLFGRFFVTSYLKRAQNDKQTSALHHRMVRSGSDAAKGVDREIRQAMGDKQGYNSPLDDEFAIELDDEIAKVTEQIKTTATTVKSQGGSLTKRVQEKSQPIVNGIADKVEETKKEVKVKTEPVVNQIQEKAIEVKKEVEKKAPKTKQEIADNVESAAAMAKDKATEGVAKVKDQAPKISEDAKHKTEEVTEVAKKDIPQAVDKAAAKASETAANAKSQAEKVSSSAAGQPGAGESEQVHDAHVKSGESYADAVKHDPEEDEMIESAVEITREEAEHLEVNPDENLSREEIVAEHTEGQQPGSEQGDSGEGAESPSLFG